MKGPEFKFNHAASSAGDDDLGVAECDIFVELSEELAFPYMMMRRKKKESKLVCVGKKKTEC